MVEYTSSKPSQFRLPGWATEFLAQESASRGVSKTQVVLEGLECLKDSRRDALMRQGYCELREVMLEEAREWDSTLMDGEEDERW